jgi:predicted naringenin-chalcone synthase
MIMNQEFPVAITDFQVIRPRYQSAQQQAVEWLAAAHAAAEQGIRAQEAQFDSEKFRAQIRKLINRYGCGSDKIGFRGHQLEDFLHFNWHEMRIYNVIKDPCGAGNQARTDFFCEVTDEIFDQFYAPVSEPPGDLIHVTCTGYASPSSAQKIAEKRNWQTETVVTHAYHMGCYGAFPALRQAHGFLASSYLSGGKIMGKKDRVDIVHTELCTLHLNPARHEPEQLVVQSLFADGFIKYSLVPCRQLARQEAGGLKILSIREEIVPRSFDAMSWMVGNWGLEMKLSRDVAKFIASKLREFLATLCRQAGYDFEELRQEALFAVHPGGPKIINQVQELLALSDGQVELSNQLLYECGNMSSATLPHIWQRLVADQSLPKGRLVLSLAFGPGLTICGGLMEII